MTDGKKKRLSMLDNLAAATPPAPSSMMTTSRPLRAARSAVDGHKVWELDPNQIIDMRVADRLSHDDVADLRDSIEASGQAVPILVRRHPTIEDNYLLVYGRRRLEAIRTSDKVTKVRALIANLDDDAAVQAQISENMARRDLTYIEKALFAHELIESGFGNQTRIAEVLTVTKSSVSMGLAILQTIGVDLVRAIGPAQGIGRPRWDALAKALEGTLIEPQNLIDLAYSTRDSVGVDALEAMSVEDLMDPSVAAFEAVLAKASARNPQTRPKQSATRPKAHSLALGRDQTGTIARTKTGIRLEVGQGPFADWIEDQAQDLMNELHQRWQQRRED